jgi:hypothetical protein
MPLQEFNMDVMLESELNVFSTGFQLNFDAGTYQALDVVPGEYFPEPFIESANIDNENGTISYTIGMTGGNGIVGSAPVCHVAFQVKQNADTEEETFFTISDVLMIDADGDQIETGVGDEMIYVVSMLVDVWPGDTDNSGEVNEIDVLPFGLYYFYTGPDRGFDLDWEPQLAIGWEPTEATFADAVGDGIINQNDLIAVNYNFGQTHGDFSKQLHNPIRNSITVPVQPVNQEFQLILNLASQENPIEDFLGISSYFTIPAVFEVQNVAAGDWMRYMGLIEFELIDDATGELYCAFTRKYMNPIDEGYGEAIIVDLKVIQGMDEPAEILLHRATTSSGDGYDFDPEVNLVLSGVSDVQDDPVAAVPKKYLLEQNYPNPFNPVTTISYQLLKSDNVKLSIYNSSSKLVETLVDKRQEAGYHSVEWNAEGVPSGVYFYKIETGSGFEAVRKCVILK